YTMKLMLSAATAAALAFSVTTSHSEEGRPQSHVPINEIVTLQSFNASDNTYAGVVQILASACSNANYNISLMVSGVKDTEDAKLKVRKEFDKISSDVDKAAA